MFEKLPTDTKIYALSAANPKESSWGTYCSPQDVVQGKHIGSCLGDLFSVSFLESTEALTDLSSETLTQHFETIKKLTTKSHVMQWGDLSYNEETIDNFMQGEKRELTVDDGVLFNWNSKIRKFIESFEQPLMFDSRFMKVKILAQIYAREKTQESLEELQEEMRSMQRTDRIFTKLIEKYSLDGDYNPKEINFDCMQPVIEDLEARCGRTTDYGLIYFKYIAQACEIYPSQAIS